MSAAVAFTVYGVPQPAGSKRAFQIPKTGRIIVTDDAKKSRPWKDDVKQAAGIEMRGAPLLDGPLTVELKFWMPRPQGHYGTGRNADQVKASAPRFPVVKPDVLKLARAVEDALTGVVYRDDAQIVVEVLQKAYTTGSARVDVRVVPLEAWPQERKAAA